MHRDTRKTIPSTLAEYLAIKLHVSEFGKMIDLKPGILATKPILNQPTYVPPLTEGRDGSVGSPSGNQAQLGFLFWSLIL